MKLLDIYEKILKYCGLATTHTGRIDTDFAYMGKEEDNFPIVMSDEGNLYLPTDRALKRAHKDGDTIFHPFHEVLGTAESEVMHILTNSLLMRINYTMMLLGHTLLHVGSDPAKQKGISTAFRNLYKDIPDIDLTADARFMEFVPKMFAKEGVTIFVNLYLKRNGRFDGRNHAFSGIVSFPLENVIQKAHGSFKKNDYQLFMKMYEAIFPRYDRKEEYGWYSDHSDIPRLDCTLRSMKTVTDALNDVIEVMGDEIPNYEELLFNTEFFKELENFDQFRKELRLIPPQKGNRGASDKEEEVSASSVQTPSPEMFNAGYNQPTARQEKTTQPVQQTQQTQQTQPSSGVYLSPPQTATPVQPQQYPPYPPQQPYQQHYQQPQQPYSPAPPTQPPQQPQGTPELRVTENNKLDFKSLEKVNPMLALAGQTSTPLTQHYMAQNRPMYDAWGRPINYQQPQMQYDAWGRPVQAMAPMQPMPQTQVDAWGRPIAPQMPQVQYDAWGRPMQQVQYDAWGRPVSYQGVAQPAYAHPAAKI